MNFINEQHDALLVVGTGGRIKLFLIATRSVILCFVGRTFLTLAEDHGVLQFVVFRCQCWSLELTENETARKRAVTKFSGRRFIIAILA